MSNAAYLGMRPRDLDGKPYARFWNPDMAPMPEHVTEALMRGPEARELAFGLDAAGELLKPGYLPLETGYTRLDKGQHFVAVRTDLPRATGAMFEWWMGWHYMEAQRYKLWHPRAHMDNGSREMRGDDPTLSDREKYMTTHYVTEYIGNHRDDIAITFLDPRQFFGDEADLSGGGTTALVCGRVDLQKAPITIGWIIHQIRKTDRGSEMRSRFWVGPPQVRGSRPGDPRNWILGSRLVQRLATPGDVARDLLVHCAMEMNHLASFLPDLYAIYHREEKEAAA
jgi:hypothetical protein